MNRLAALILAIFLATFAYGQEAVLDTTKTSPQDTSARVLNNVTKVSSFDHLGHNMLLSAFGWYIGNTFYQEKAARGESAQAPRFIIAPIAYDIHKGAVLSVQF